MNVSRFHVSCIQETDYTAHFTCGELLDFREHFEHTGRCINVVRLSANCVHAFPKDQQLCTHGHRRDCSAAAAIFSNGTYFVDMPRIQKKNKKKHILQSVVMFTKCFQIFVTKNGIGLFSEHF
jgi:hypothetical protein